MTIDPHMSNDSPRLSRPRRPWHRAAMLALHRVVALALPLLATACTRPAPEAPPPLVEDLIAWAPPSTPVALLLHRTTAVREIADLAALHFGGVPGVDLALKTVRAWTLGPMQPATGTWGAGLALDRGVGLFAGPGQIRVVFGASELTPALASAAAILRAAGASEVLAGPDHISLGHKRLTCALRPPFAVCDSEAVPEVPPGRPAWGGGDAGADLYLRVTGEPLQDTPVEQIELGLRSTDLPLQARIVLKPAMRGPLQALVPKDAGASAGAGQIDVHNAALLKLGFDGPAIFETLAPMAGNLPPPIKAAFDALQAAWSGDLWITADGGLTHPVGVLGLRDAAAAEPLLAALLALAPPDLPKLAREDAARSGLRRLRITLPTVPDAPALGGEIDLHYAVVGDALVFGLVPADVARRTRRKVQPAELGVLGRRGVHGLRLANPLVGLSAAWPAEVFRLGAASDALTLLGTAAAMRGALSLEVEPDATGVQVRLRWPLLASGDGRDGFLKAARAEMAGDQLTATRLFIDVAAAHPGSPFGVEARSRLTGSSGGPVVAVVGILSSIAIPAFMKYTRRSKTAEATMNLRRLFDRSVGYYEDHKAFPPSTPLTPAQPACEGGSPVKHLPGPDAWAHPTWRALDFSIDDPHVYQYQFESDGQGFTARAFGDLDCDGVRSTFERVGNVDPDGHISGGVGLFMHNELE